MNLFCVRVGAIAASVCLTAVSLADLSVTPTSDAMALVNGALGAPITGLSVTGASYSGASQASGTYTGLTFGPFNSLTNGLILTTGDATFAVGPNDEEGATSINGGPSATFNDYDGTSDIDLNEVATLSINFHTDSAMSLSFDFTFGSEEYYYFVTQSTTTLSLLSSMEERRLRSTRSVMRSISTISF